MRTLSTFAVILLASPLAAAPPEPVRFNRDVRPILSDHCFNCHGPDKARRKGDLRLDTEEGAKAVIKPGKPGESELVKRITAHDPAERMPPAKFDRQLTAKQIDTLTRWVADGAKWEPHWAFIPPTRPALPTVKNATWIKNPIDAFVLNRLELEGLSPSPPADRVTLIRRMSLDLTGLPPSPEEVDAFLKDTTPDAVEKLADRLLASPRYGERMAWRWLEAARYADTNGYQTDADRDMWRWRDWVIEAYNRNLPFDQFTIEQIAGDMLPKPTLDQRIATGFNRNHRGNAEGGIIPEEYAVEYVVDRVETTSTVWLGLTAGCARCHDHKYDPLSQKEFYRLFALFNNVPEKGRAVKFGNSPPYVKAPTREQEIKLKELEAKVKEAETGILNVKGEFNNAFGNWQKTAKPAVEPWSPTRGQLAHFTFDQKNNITSFTGMDGKTVSHEPGGPRFVDTSKAGDFGFDDSFSFSLWAHPRHPTGPILTRMVDEEHGEGYGIHLVSGKVQVHLTKRWLDDSLRIETEQPVDLMQWHHIVVTYDGSRTAAGVKVYIDGVEVKCRVLFDELNQSFQTKEPLRFASGGKDFFRGFVNNVYIFGRVLESEEAAILSESTTPAEILGTATDRRTPTEAAKLRAFFLETAAPKHIREAFAARTDAQDALLKFRLSIPTVMVMEEMPTPRDTHVLIRGEYDKKGEQVTAGIPKSLESPGTAIPGNRLDFAKWLVSPSNPLTARVAVNRVWQHHFGTGLVKTVEDFGTQGDFPSHPELLDWLACEFATDWDLKRLHKLIVTSATYRQSSRIPKDDRDGDNRMLARFPRYRLSADVIRDQALFTSGLLVEKQGGPSVKPYQPAGLWKELSGGGDYVPDKGENLYRRSLYTFWKRTAAPPGLAAFDAAGRETCWVRESRTNTPLQALTLLNETGFVEAGRGLAQRVMKESKSTDERLRLAFRRVTCRLPTANELKVLRSCYDYQLAEFRKNPPGIQRLLAIGELKNDPAHDTAELAAMTTICGLLLNLDEVVTKE